MLVAVHGPQSPILSGVLKLLTAIGDLILGSSTVVPVANLADLHNCRDTVSSHTAGMVILLLETADQTVFEALSSAQLPLITSTDSFENITNFLISSTNRTFIDALRAAAFMSVRYHSMHNVASELKIGIEDYQTSISGILTKVCEFIKLQIDEEGVRLLVANFLQSNEPVKTFQGLIDQITGYERNLWPALHWRDQRALQSIAASYNELLAGRAVAQFDWAREVFVDGDVPPGQLLGSKLLVGPARLVFFGPYLFLPAGRWHCEMSLEILDCEKDTLVLVDVFNGASLSAVTMRFPKRGVFAFHFEFETTEFEKPVEIRMHLLKGALDGEILLLGARLTHQLHSAE